MKDLHEMMDQLFQKGGFTIADPELTVLSSPLPAMTDGRLTELFFLCSNQAQAVRSRPYAWLAVEPEDGRLLRYCDCRAGDFAASLEPPLAQELDYSAPEGVSVRELMKLKRRYVELYQEIRTFVFTPAPSGEQRKIMAEYRELLARLWRPELRRCYEALSPEFFAWLEENI